MYSEDDIRELDQRSGDGIDVRLLWSPQSEQVCIDVRDDRLGGSFRFAVEPTEALAAFRHPYAYAVPHYSERALAA